MAGLLLSVAFWRSRWPAITASAVLVAYVGFQYVQKQNAIDFGEQYAREQSLREVEIAARIRRPPSAFNWTVFVSDQEMHRYAHINLIRREPRRYQPGDGFIARIDSPLSPARPGGVDNKDSLWRGAGVRAWKRSLECAGTRLLPLVRRRACVRRRYGKFDVRMVHRFAVFDTGSR